MRLQVRVTEAREAEKVSTDIPFLWNLLTVGRIYNKKGLIS